MLNPEGARAHNPAIKQVRKMSDAQIAEVATLILEGRKADLEALKNDPDAPPLKLAVASVIVHIINKGDAFALNALLDRVVGRVKQRIEVTGADGGPLEFAQMSDEMLEMELERYERIRFRKTR